MAFKAARYILSHSRRRQVNKKMKLIIALCLVAVAVAAPPPQYNNYNEAQVLRYENDNIGTGSYRYAFEQSDGTKQEAQGELQNEGREDEQFVVKGIFSWVGPDGVTYIVRYVADRNGYQPEIEEGPGGAVPPGVVASLLG